MGQQVAAVECNVNQRVDNLEKELTSEPQPPCFNLAQAIDASIPYRKAWNVEGGCAGYSGPNNQPSH